MGYRGGAPQQCSLGAAACRLPSIYADARYIDAVLVSKATPSRSSRTAAPAGGGRRAVQPTTTA